MHLPTGGGNRYKHSHAPSNDFSYYNGADKYLLPNEVVAVVTQRITYVSVMVTMMYSCTQTFCATTYIFMYSTWYLMMTLWTYIFDVLSDSSRGTEIKPDKDYGDGI